MIFLIQFLHWWSDSDASPQVDARRISSDQLLVFCPFSTSTPSCLCQAFLHHDSGYASLSAWQASELTTPSWIGPAFWPCLKYSYVLSFRYGYLDGRTWHVCDRHIIQDSAWYIRSYDLFGHLNMLPVNVNYYRGSSVTVRFQAMQ